MRKRGVWRLAVIAAKTNLDTVYVKVHDGAQPFPSEPSTVRRIKLAKGRGDRAVAERLTATHAEWSLKRNRPLMAAFRRHGIGVMAWGYNYATNPIEEAAIIAASFFINWVNLTLAARPATLNVVSMKKRYLAVPALALGAVVVGNLVLRPSTPKASAEDVSRFVAPRSDDPRHPVEAYNVPLVGGQTESEVLAGLATTIYPQDRVEFVLDPAWGLGTIVHIERALPVTIRDGKTTILTRTWSSSVGELLDDLHRPLGELDKANYRPEDALTSDMTITLVRVSKTRLTMKETIDFTTTEVPDPNLDHGVTEVTSVGAAGERRKEFEVTREDGVEVSRVLIKNEVVKAPQQRVVRKGTRLKIGRVAAGKASWYAAASTKVAANIFKKGTVLRLTNLVNGKQIQVTVDDTGEFGSDVVVDLNPDYFKQLGGTLGQGILQNVRAEEILNP